MSDSNSGSQLNVTQLILLPSVITLAVTLLRLMEELEHWSRTFFSSSAGGGGSLVGITWLAPVFGIYFAAKLVLSEEGPRSVWRAIGFAVLGVAVGYSSFFVGGALHINGFYSRLVYIWLAFALAGLVTWPGWPSLFKIQAAYAYAARVPVAAVMIIAIYGSWGTHYDVAPGDMPPMSLFAKWLWIGFFPQLLLWVGYTIATGMFFGSLTAGVMRIMRVPARMPAS